MKPNPKTEKPKINHALISQTRNVVDWYKKDRRDVELRLDSMYLEENIFEPFSLLRCLVLQGGKKRQSDLCGLCRSAARRQIKGFCSFVLAAQ